MKFGTFQLGDIVFDPTTRALTYKDGRPAQLRNKSKAVLEFLLEHPNRTVTKAELLDNVWSGITVTDESLVQCIADVRRIVGDDARSVVETVPREGYRINVQARRAPVRPLLLVASVAALLAGAGWLFWPKGDAAQELPRPTTIAETPTGPPGTDSTEAFLEVLQGRASANRFSQDESLIAERHFRRAIAVDPAFARAYAELGTLLAVRIENDWTVLKQADQEKALFYAEKAIALEPDLWLGHYALGRLHSVFANLDVAEAHLETAMYLRPDNEDARAYFGIVKNFRGDYEIAISILQQAIASHPNPPYWYYLGLGNALFNRGRNEEAAVALLQCLKLAGNSPYCLRYLIGVYAEMGLLSDAQATAQAYASMGFDLSVGSIMGMMSYHHPGSRERLEGALRRAGLPD